MHIELTLFAKDGSRHDLFVDGHPGAAWSQALAAFVSAPQQVFKGSAPVDLEASLGSATIVSGDVLSVGEPIPEEVWEPARPAVHVVGGADAGHIVPVDPGRASVGRSRDNQIVVADPTVSRQHAELTIGADGAARLVDTGSANGTIVAGVRLASGSAALLKPGEHFALGQATLKVSGPVEANGSVVVSPDGELQFNRVMRYPTAWERPRFVLPTSPDDGGGQSALPQYVGSVTMLVTGMASAFVFGNVLFAVLGLVGPLALIGTTALVQRGEKMRDRKRRAEAQQQRRRILEDIEAAGVAERNHAWQATLDPARSALAARGPTSDLWSCDAVDAHALRVRVGTVDRRADIEISEGTDRVATPTVMAAPVTVDLRAHPILGIAGPVEAVQGVARGIVHQLAVGRSPDDLVIVHLGAESNRASWSWLRWLPHVRPAGDAVHAVSPTAEALKARLDELTALQRQRLDLEVMSGRKAVLLPEVLVILDGAGSLRRRSSVVSVLRDAEATGVRILALDTHLAKLPAEASARLVVEPPTATLELKGAPTIEALTPDQVSLTVCERSARALAPLTPLGVSEGGGMPRSVRFLDLVGLDRAGESEIQRRWCAENEGDVTLGVDEHGNPARVNLVTDGPHALIAGTSGSGKSELLRSFIAGLAINSAPSDLALLLIDFKGGGAFGKLAHLPQVVGYADDLSIGGALANRLLDSLKAELDHRKARFKEAGNVEGLLEYRRARDRGGAGLPSIARLVIVVDEFAELKEDHPDFIEGLVNVARVGRSLGVHLVLATQQPAGVVTPQIRDNANLRICLRVLDPGTSLDIVRTPLAASFSNRDKGRAVMVTGDAPPLAFQTALLSAPRRIPDPSGIPAPAVREVPWEQCGASTPGAVRAEAGSDDNSDLADLVAAVRDTADRLGSPPSRRPWQPPIPSRIELAYVTRLAGPTGRVVFGIEDHPKEQRHVGLTFRIGSGNLGIAGGRASGRSTALRTLAVALAEQFDADALHLYVIDQSPASSLRPLVRLPNCGVVATRSDRYVTTRLVARLREEQHTRSELLGRNGFASIRELAQAGHPVPPWIVLMVDGWDTLASGDAEVLRDDLVRLAEEGPALGIQLVVAGGKALSTSRLLSSFTDLLVLRFDQRDDMSAFGVPVRALPPDLEPGRAFRPGAPDAIQIAILAGGDSSDAQNQTLRTFAETLPAPDQHPPMEFAELPTRISLSEAELRMGATRVPQLGFIAAVGGDALDVRVVDLDELATPFVIAGPPGSGRTQGLALIAHQLASKGVRVLAWNISAKDRGLFPRGVVLDGAPETPVGGMSVVLVDDADRLDANDPIITALWEQRDAAVVLAGDASELTGFSGWKGRLRSGANGLLMSPRFRGGEVVGATISLEQSFSGAPGRAYLSSRGRIELVQIPIVDAHAAARLAL